MKLKTKKKKLVLKRKTDTSQYSATHVQDGKYTIESDIATYNITIKNGRVTRGDTKGGWLMNKEADPLFAYFRRYDAKIVRDPEEKH